MYSTSPLRYGRLRSSATIRKRRTPIVTIFMRPSGRRCTPTIRAVVPTFVRLRSHTDLLAALNEDDAEVLFVFDAFANHELIPRLKDVQRQCGAGKEH